MSEHGETLAAILGHIQAAGNVDLAAVVSLDGFLIDSARGPECDIDAEEFAAVVTNGVLVTQALGQELRRGAFDGAFFEYAQGTVIINLVADDVALVILTGADANLGRLRLLVRRYRAELAAATQAMV